MKFLIFALVSFVLLCGGLEYQLLKVTKELERQTEASYHQAVATALERAAAIEFKKNADKSFGKLLNCINSLIEICNKHRIDLLINEETGEIHEAPVATIETGANAYTLTLK